MDSLGWDNSQILMNTSSLWSNPQHGSEGCLIISNSNSGAYSTERMDLAEDAFNQIQELQKAQTSQLNSDSEQCREARSLVVIPNQSQELYANSSLVINKGYAANSSVPDFNNNGGVNVSTGSFDSLNCLLSGTTSNTDTSVEDDGISMFFSDCRNLFNLGANSTVSSGESGNNYISNATNSKEMHCLVSELDESQSSSDQYRKNGKSSETNRVSIKRSHDQSELKVDAKHPYDLLKTVRSTSGFKLISENPPRLKKPRLDKRPSSSNISFQRPSSSVSSSIEEPDPEAIAQMKEMIYRAAVFRPVNLGFELQEKPKRKNVKISTDPQTVAARHRRERISERIRVLQRLVPGGSKMDTASMLDEAANYLKFLRSQVKALENLGYKLHSPSANNIIAFTSLHFNHNHSLIPMKTHFPPLQNPNDYFDHHPQSYSRTH